MYNYMITRTYKGINYIAFKHNNKCSIFQNFSKLNNNNVRQSRKAEPHLGRAKQQYCINE